MSRSTFLTIPRTDLERLTEAARDWAEFNLEDEGIEADQKTPFTELIALCDLWEA